MITSPALALDFGQRPRANNQRLLTVQLHNQLLVHRQINIFAFRQGQNLTFVIIAIDLQPVGCVLVAGKFLCRLQDGQLLAAFADSNLLAHAYLIRRNVDLAAIHLDVAVPHQLTGLAARHAKTKAIDHVVQTALQLLQKHFAGDAAGARRLLEIVPELAFLGKVNALGLLLFAQLQTVADDFGLAVLAMLARGKIPLLDGTLIAEALGAFEEQLHALTAAETADGIGITCQVVFSLLDDRFTGLASPFVPDENQHLALSR